MKLDFLDHEISNIHSAALILGAAGLLSRILGVFRDRLLAGSFGAGRELDAYYAAFQIPDFMSTLFLLGAGTAAILPMFQEDLTQNREEARRLISHLSLLFLVGSALLALVAFFLSPYIMRLVAPGFSESERSLAILLTRIMLLSPIFLGLSNIFSSVVQSFQRFLSYALAPVLYNAGIIIGIVWLVPFMGTAGLGAGVALGAVLHFLTQFQTIARLGFTPRFSPHFKDFVESWGSTLFSGKVRRVAALSFPRVLSVSISQITLLILVAIGSTLAEGSISVFQLARNLFYVPIGIFGVSYAVALFPRLSTAYIKKDAREFYHELFWGIRTILFWLAPSLVLFIVLRAHIVRVALGAGLFSWEDTRLSAAVLAAFSLAMLAEGLASLLIKGYYALENTWLPLVINFGASIVSLGLALTFTFVLAGRSEFAGMLATLFRISDLPHPEVLGLALGFSLGLLLNILFLYKALTRLASKVFQKSEYFPVTAVVKIVFSALLAGATAYLVRVSFSETLPLITFAQVLGQGVLAGAAGFGVYFGALFLLKDEEIFSVWNSLRRRLFRVGALPKHWDSDMGGRSV